MRIRLGVLDARFVRFTIADMRTTAFPIFLFLTCLVAGGATLTWNAAENREWNTQATNWGGERSYFQNGDVVTFGPGATGEVYIGSAGIPAGVAPAVINVTGDGYSFQGGDITTGALALNARTRFTNYTQSLSYPGGTVIHGILTFDATKFVDNAAFGIGSGPISITTSGGLQIDTGTNQRVRLTNDLVVSVIPGPYAGFTSSGGGTVDFSGNVLFQSGGLILGNRSTGIFSGKWTIDQSQNGAPKEIQAWSGRSIITGSIVDGPGSYSNKLTLYGYSADVIIAGSNSYRHGTLLEGVVRVSPEGSLGVGDVNFRNFGVLYLTSSNNISPNAMLTVNAGSSVNVAGGVTIRVAALWSKLLSGSPYTNGGIL